MLACIHHFRTSEKRQPLYPSQPFRPPPTPNVLARLERHAKLISIGPKGEIEDGAAPFACGIVFRWRSGRLLDGSADFRIQTKERQHAIVRTPN